jgi:hypothetical protein
MYSAKNELDSNCISEVSAILSLSEHLIIDLRKPAPSRGPFKTGFDLNAWHEDKFHKPLNNFVVEEGTISLTMKESQLDKLTSFSKKNNHLPNRDYYFVAVETIFPRSDLFYRQSID